MTTKNFKITDPIGLHARPAASLTSTASKFTSDIKIALKEKQGNLKSILNIMALGVKTNDVITISADGADEVQAIEALTKLLIDNKTAVAE